MPDPITLAIAVYGAVASTLAIAWQVYAWRHERQTRVTVRASMGMTLGDQVVDAVIVEIVNRSDHVVKVNAVEFELQDGSDRRLALTSFPREAPIPHEIGPRDSYQTWCRPDDLTSNGFRLDRSLVVRIRLGDNTVIRSKAKALFKRSA